MRKGKAKFFTAHHGARANKASGPYAAHAVKTDRAESESGWGFPLRAEGGTSLKFRKSLIPPSQLPPSSKRRLLEWSEIRSSA